jgi:MFS family permease
VTEQPTAAGPVPSIGLIGLVIGGLIALTVIGSSAVVVALPVVQEDLGLDVAGSAWVMATFSLAFSVATVLFGRLADLRGLRLTLRLGVVLLIVGSVMAALAWSFPSLLAARVVQGAGAGAIPVASTGIVNARFTGATRGRVLGSLVAVVSIVSGSGPLIGGLLTQLLSWRAVLAVPALSLLLVEPVARLAPPSPPAGAAQRLDWLGAVLVAVPATGLALLLQSPATGAGARAAGLFGVMVAAGLLGLGLHLRRTPDGFLPRELVGNGPLIAAAVAGLTLLAAYFAAMFATPKLLTSSVGWTPLQIGLALLPAAAVGAVSSRIAGSLASRLGRFRLAAGAAAASSVGLVVAGLGQGRPVPLIVGLALAACGFGGGQVALIDALPLLVDPSEQNGALGLFNLLFFTGGAIGSAAVGGLSGPLGINGALLAVAVLPAGGAVLALVARRAAHRAHAT